MNALDWSIVGTYLIGLVAMSWWVGRRQTSTRDYYLGGNRIGPVAIAVSTLATQCSSNSLLGGPAFVMAVGGLLWLQYELAVPLAMVGIMLFLVPFFRQQGCVTVYEYLERRFGPHSRTLLSLLFQGLRAFATGITVYGLALVIQMIVGIPFWVAVLLFGVITVLYDFLGGIRADIYSDVIQMVVLYAGIAACFVLAVQHTGGWAAVIANFPATQARTLDFAALGLRDGETFAFWPMLIGGFFLYLSYYGCDQTQVQRLLSTRDADDGNLALFLNGLLRFPLVLTYCLVGVALGAFLARHPDFLQHLTDPTTGTPNYNLAVPVFALHYLPHGAIGLIIAALFAAAMSSMDSTINSLSAATLRDVVERYLTRAPLEGRAAFFWSRGTTVFWGVVCIAFSFHVHDISPSIIESINKVGSLANGPILGTFLLATLTRRTHDLGAVAGIAGGFAANLLTWRLLPGVSWLWWNASGCLLTVSIGYLASVATPWLARRGDLGNLVFQADVRRQFQYRRHWPRYQAILVAYTGIMLAVLWGLHGLWAG
ncbi:MAG: sodium/solute symporter [Lentisphaerae bacterium]|nr:sodium/solute symporter [Lentisphaerota bacterium]